jgi:hypothetical protein
MPTWLYEYFATTIAPLISGKDGRKLVKPAPLSDNSRPYSPPTLWIHPPEPMQMPPNVPAMPIDPVLLALSLPPRTVAFNLNQATNVAVAVSSESGVVIQADANHNRIAPCVNFSFA